MSNRFSHVIGIDDGPFARDHRGRVLVVATAYAGLRLEGILSTRVMRDGADATRAVGACVSASRFANHTRLIMFQGIALAGFNVIDIHGLHETLGIPVLVVARRPPSLPAIHDALLGRVRGGKKKWALIEKAGPMEPLGALMVQRAGISLDDAGSVIARLSVNGLIPEPLRVAHLIAGGVTTGHSRGRA
ncbi:Hypothetical protein A7982_06406 [Minicystis rosea]|nr:Hypothetical protein A7982_06406 [Minicystis rosea]